MALAAAMTASTMCTFGAAPGTLMVIPVAMVMGSTGPMSSFMDGKPFANVLPFGVCMSLGNPAVAAATAAALGALTPMPCTPMTPMPWMPGKPTVLIGNFPLLDQMSKLTCMFGGVISIVVPGQTAAIV